MKIFGVLQCGVQRKIFACMSSICALVLYPVSVSYSGWKEDVGVFMIGIVSDKQDAIALRQAEPFREALQQEINMPVKVFVAANYRQLIDVQADKKVHYAVHTAASFATTWVKCKCIEPVAAAKSVDGSVKYHSILMVKKDRISKLAELKGKRVAVSSKNSLSGFLIPKHELGDKILKFVDLPTEPSDTVIVNAGSPSSSHKLFQANLVDGLFGWSTMSGLANAGYSAGTLVDLVQLNEISMDEIQLLWQSKPIFNGPHAIDASAPEALKSSIREFLLRLYEKNPRAYDSVENYRGGGFAKVEHANYQPLIEFVDAREISTKSGGEK